MRVAIISDVHANIDAFRAVVDDADVEEWWCLGDVVGYGAAPNECLTLLRDLPHVAIPGNHDWAAIGCVPCQDFNPEAYQCITWTGEVLAAEHRDYLRALPETRVIDDFTLVHGSPRAPIEEYVLSTRQARENFKHFSTPFCLHGHTHQAVYFTYQGTPHEPESLDLQAYAQAGKRLLCNPGAVGQPRDGDPRASYAVLDRDAGTLMWCRVPYDIDRAAARIRAAGLPDIEALRLSVGR
ncbi:MAG: metallophosphatase family protein [Chloroflexi bacterium]|nr:metallophosphatase family protein [Chloroflexota bacterium]